MAKTIYKYTFGEPSDQVVSMPQGAKVVEVGQQLGMICFWAIVEPSSEIVERKFSVYLTGEPLQNFSGEYIGTATIGHGVYHIFDGERAYASSNT